MNAWKASPPHNDVMLNKGIWSELTWQALGGTAGGQFATAWFGVAPGRPLGAPSEPSAAPKAEKGVGDAPPNPGTR